MKLKVHPESNPEITVTMRLEEWKKLIEPLRAEREDEAATFGNIPSDDCNELIRDVLHLDRKINHES